MADERLNKIEQWAWKTISGAAMALAVWYLSGINSSIKTLSNDIVAIKLQDSANTITINTIKADVGDLKVVNKEVLGRIGSLEKSSAQHEQQLRQLSK